MQLKEDDDDLPAFDIGMTSKDDTTDVVKPLKETISASLFCVVDRFAK